MLTWHRCAVAMTATSGQMSCPGSKTVLSSADWSGQRTPERPVRLLSERITIKQLGGQQYDSKEAMWYRCGSVSMTVLWW